VDPVFFVFYGLEGGVKPKKGSRFGYPEVPRESHLEACRIFSDRHVFSGGRFLFDVCEISGQLDRPTLDIRRASRLGSLIVSLPQRLHCSLYFWLFLNQSNRSQRI
jgi:hypothetical protein